MGTRFLPAAVTVFSIFFDTDSNQKVIWLMV